MYDCVSLDDLESRDVDAMEPSLKAVGYELRPAEMRPNVWVFDAGEATNRHRQAEQEELYLVLAGRFEMTVDDGDDRETVEMERGDVAVVPPETWRRHTALEDGSRLFVVGAPNVKDDGVRAEDGDRR